MIKQKGVPPEQLSLEGFEGLDFSGSTAGDKEIDYEKYLASFDDCTEDDVDFESLDDWGDDEF